MACGSHNRTTVDTGRKDVAEIKTRCELKEHLTQGEERKEPSASKYDTAKRFSSTLFCLHK
jgi:hypothetical protein